MGTLKPLPWTATARAIQSAHHPSCTTGLRGSIGASLPPMPRSPSGARPARAPQCLRPHRPRHLPRIQHGVLDVIEPDGQLRFGHPHPGKPMRGPAKAELGASDPDRGQRAPTCPLDDLLIPTRIEVGLVMVVPGKVNLNLAP